MKNRKCPNPCCSAKNQEQKIHRHGFFSRTSDGRKIPRFKCAHCNKTFSNATFDPAFGQNKRRLNHRIRGMISSGNSERRMAELLNTTRKTISRKILYLGIQGELQQDRYLDRKYSKRKIELMQFDDLITFEKSKCLPLSLSLAVNPSNRDFLTFELSSMPATGRLAETSRRKYGPRKDERRQGLDKMFESIKPYLDEKVSVVSDSHPFYKPAVQKHLPNATYTQILGGRGGQHGQGELRNKTYDPMFCLNHTCAMLRDNIKRLARKTWCTTKNPEKLKAILNIYINYHNQVLLAK